MLNTFIRRLYEMQQQDYWKDGMSLGYRPEHNEKLLSLLGDNVNVKKKEKIYTYITAARKPTVEECLAEFHWDKASNELGLYIMLNGEYNNYYGRYDGATLEGFVKLLLDDPINWERSNSPQSAKWAEFAGTFAESDYSEDMLEVGFVCGDSYFPEHEFGIEMPSIADILKSSSGFFLNKLED